MQHLLRIAVVGMIVSEFLCLTQARGMIDFAVFATIKQGLEVAVLFLVIRQMASRQIALVPCNRAIQRVGYPMPVAHKQCSSASVASAIGCDGTQWNVEWPEQASIKQRKGCRAMSRKGFTLIELLIVIAILGILVALILPRFADIRSDANTKVCVANIRGLVSAMSTYAIKENASITWGGSNNVDFLVTAGYLAQAPQCPVPPNGTYTLSGTQDTPAAACPNVGANPTHVWP